MGTIRTGITTAAVAKYLRGPGALYTGFTDLENPGTALGETRGGSSFSWGLVFHDVEPDGAMGLIVGHRFIDKIIPTLSVSLLEHSVNEHLRHLPGADSADQAPTGVKGEYIGTGAEVTIGVAPGGSPNIDESTLEVWRTVAALGVGSKCTLNTDYGVYDQVTCASVEVGDTVTIGGVTFTAAAAQSLPDREFDQSGTDTQCATSIAACVNDATYGVTGVTATSAAAIVSLTRATAGTKNTMSSSNGTRLALAYQVVKEIVAGAILDDDKITVFYVYDATASGDTFTIITPGQIAAADHLTNVALLCEVAEVGQTYPVIFIIKNALSEPDTIEIPGTRMDETLLKTTWTGFFDPDDGLDMDNAPVELWVPYGI